MFAYASEAFGSVMIETVLRRQTLATKLKSAVADMPTRVPDAVARVRRALKAGGIGAAGPPYARYLQYDEKEGVFRLEVGIPLWAAVVLAYGDVFPSALPGGRVLRVDHEGPHTRLSASFAKLDALMDAEGLMPMGPAWESYVIGPETEPDRSRWKTAIYQPV